MKKYLSVLILILGLVFLENSAIAYGQNPTAPATGTIAPQAIPTSTTAPVAAPIITSATDSCVTQCTNAGGPFCYEFRYRYGETVAYEVVFVGLAKTNITDCTCEKACDPLHRDEFCYIRKSENIHVQCYPEKRQS